MAGCDIIVVGASAGGVQALSTVVAGLPRSLPAAVAIVLHTGSETGRLAEVLNRNGNIPAHMAVDGAPLARGHVYVAPANYHLTLDDGHIALTIGPKVNRHRPAIDELFESAASTFGKRVAGVLLTGYRDDGTAGLLAIKRGGGIAVVQDPRTAFAPNMPSNALKNVSVDYCVTLSEIAPLLVRLADGHQKRRRK